ncbi:hypothetical protein [Streptomyces sp. A1547]|uniref:hypothetical protein n=1 Tax=Streptomyces sp. A1547 TaxID=2563105 RepID=UPI00144A763B|nr:hypothetical protein [Streptomyces sp. A1547]
MPSTISSTYTPSPAIAATAGVTEAMRAANWPVPLLRNIYVLNFIAGTGLTLDDPTSP